MSETSRKKWIVALIVIALLIAAGGVVVFDRVFGGSGTSGPVAVPPGFVQALEGMREAVLAYDERHGYLPDIVSPDWALEDDGAYADAKKLFVEATGGGKLAVAVVTDSEKTTRLIGVFSGDRMSNKAFRKNLARSAQAGFSSKLYGVDNTPYKADGLAAYIRLNDTREK